MAELQVYKPFYFHSFGCMLLLKATDMKAEYNLTCAFLSFASLHLLDHDFGALLSPEILKIHLPHAQSCIEEYGFLRHLKDALI